MSVCFSAVTVIQAADIACPLPTLSGSSPIWKAAAHPNILVSSKWENSHARAFIQVAIVR